jgi:hypothetical protein
MPVFEIKYKRADEPLEERELMWVDTLSKLLRDEKFLKHYSQKAIERANDFHIDKIIQEWRKLLENV